MLAYLVFVLLPTVTLGAAFSYDRCNSTTGPTSWNGQCNPNQQAGTPIDLCAAVSFPSNTKPTFSLTNYDTSRKVKFFNPGYTLQFNIIDNSPTLQAGTLAYTVGRSTNSSTQTWILLQAHLHWGRNVNEGSEHFVQGGQYPAEIHLVHYNSRYANISEAVSSGNSDALLVVGVFFEVSTSDLNIMSVMADAVATETQTATELSSSVVLTELFDGSGDFYSYAGGLTTPGCNEIVTWVVMKTPRPIKQATLNKIYKASTNPPKNSSVTATGTSEYISKYGNFRPLQARGGRTVYYTGGATAACTNASESWTCSSSSTSDAHSFGPSLLYTLFFVSFLAMSTFA